MTIIEIKLLDNGSHENQSWPDNAPIPNGYAVIPDDMDTPNFPFGEITVSDGVVTSWTPLPLPEPPAPAPVEPTQLDVLQAQVTYTAMKTGTLIGGTK